MAPLLEPLERHLESEKGHGVGREGPQQHRPDPSVEAPDSALGERLSVAVHRARIQGLCVRLALHSRLDDVHGQLRDLPCDAGHASGRQELPAREVGRALALLDLRALGRLVGHEVGKVLRQVAQQVGREALVEPVHARLAHNLLCAVERPARGALGQRVLRLQPDHHELHGRAHGDREPPCEGAAAGHRAQRQVVDEARVLDARDGLQRRAVCVEEHGRDGANAHQGRPHAAVQAARALLRQELARGSRHAHVTGLHDGLDGVEGVADGDLEGAPDGARGDLLPPGNLAAGLGGAALRPWCCSSQHGADVP
mmetsp:Transcript_7152/g.21579  ORF Transcript_7152/g.21579 Transcript_7152/m.21579 type:complete len:312 (+) Transcript_7152:2843-3778(+)